MKELSRNVNQVSAVNTQCNLITPNGNPAQQTENLILTSLLDGYYKTPDINAAKFYSNGSPKKPMRHGRKHQCGAG